jgi:RNA polymerase sigma factor (sigma-70 family)
MSVLERSVCRGADGGEREVDRTLLMKVAYRLLGSMADAEDVAQETYVRWYKMTGAERNAIRTPAAWFVRVATRICLDILTSARHRREHYVGPWLPEPVPGQRVDAPTASTDPADLVAIDEHITMAMLVVLDAMTPAERVSFVLHDVFRFPFSEISDVLG